MINNNLSKLIQIFLLAFSFSLSAHAATIWNGQNITFTKPSGADWINPANQDRLTDNVWLTRQNAQGLFNIALETSYSDPSSPLGTEWAFGQLNSWNTLSYSSWVNAVNRNPPGMVGEDMVVHLITDDIYLGIKFLSWSGAGGGGGFSYERSTAAIPIPTAIWLFGSALAGLGVFGTRRLA